MGVLCKDISAYVFLVLCVQVVDSKAIRNAANALDYLMKYNYMNPAHRRMGALLNAQAVINAIQQFQRFAGLNATGKVDNATLELMNKPRCGDPDVVGNGITTRRRRRFVLQGSKWLGPNIYYKITKYPNGYTYQARSDVDEAIKRAFQVWSDVTPLVFQVASGTYSGIDINIRFEAGDHGDGNPFDGPANTLAHAFYPEFHGATHFDDEEQWTFYSYEGINLFQVAAHEFGHALGLAHTDVDGALMAPFYEGYQSDFKLHEDDTQAIQTLYGAPKHPPAPRATSRPIRPTVRPDEGEGVCDDGKVDAMFTSADGYTYAFKGRFYYQMDNEYEYVFKTPRLISENWPEIQYPVDAVLGDYSGFTYFFKDTFGWIYRGREYIGTYFIYNIGFEGIPISSIDAVFMWSGNGRIYFIRGAYYWKAGGDESYPRHLSVWNGLPSRVDSAMVWPGTGQTYFFSGTLYYRFNDQDFTVDYGYPKVIKDWWFDCDVTSDGTRESSGGKGELDNFIGNFWRLAKVNYTSTTTTQATCRSTTQPPLTCGASACIVYMAIILVSLATSFCVLHT